MTAETSLRKSSSMGSSPKFGYITPHNTLKDGILFQTNERNYAHVGPGHYLVPSDTILKKSHNLRTMSIGNKSNLSTNESFTKSFSIKSRSETVHKITDIRSNLGTPGTSFRIPDIERPKTSGNLYEKRITNGNQSYSSNNNSYLVINML